jgi:UDP-3-O-[3-hydroxymyristoyl] glucosamine N-acyltransferase
MRLGALAGKLGAQLGEGADPEILIRDVQPLAEAGAGDISFFDNRKYLDQLQATRASACLVAPAFASRVPGGTAAAWLSFGWASLSDGRVRLSAEGWLRLDALAATAR